MASIQTTVRKDGKLEIITYNLKQTESGYKITTTNNNNEEHGIDEVTLLKTKHRTVAVKLFAHIATNDIEEYYKINNHIIKI